MAAHRSRHPESNSGKKGLRLVLVRYRFARYCAPVDDRVIDPATAKVISRQSADDECDARCAEKALGTNLSEDLGLVL